MIQIKRKKSESNIIKMIKYYLLTTLIIIILLYSYICFACSKTIKNQNLKYNISKSDDFIIYNLNINNVANESFEKLKNRFKIKLDYDYQFNIVLFDKKEDFLNKKYKSIKKDHITICSSKIEDVPQQHRKIDEHYLYLIPNTIIITGSLDIKESLENKENILKELQKTINDQQLKENILSQIREKYFLGDYNEDLTLDIYYNCPEFLVAEFSIWFTNKMLYYQYLFSKTKQPYPY